MGNSEVGHLNLGAGRIVYQDLTRINKAIEEGELTRKRSFAGNFCQARGHRGSIFWVWFPTGVFTAITSI